MYLNPMRGVAVKQSIMYLNVLAFLVPVCFVSTTANGQMGLRENQLFSSKAFANVGPAIGSKAPKLDLKDFDGKSVTLESYRGQTVVLVKGGYT